LEDSGMPAAEEGAAANKRARERVAAPAPRSPEANEVAPRDGPNRARPAGAAVRAVRPVRHPLLHVPPHVEDSYGRLAAPSGARVHRMIAKAAEADVAVCRLVVRP